MPHCRVAPSLGALEGTHQEAWGTEEYVWWRDWNKPTVFFGVYDLRDYLALLIHRGGGWILWAGSDLRNLDQGFLFNDGKLKWLSRALRGRLTGLIVRLVSRYDNWVENDWEWQILASRGIYASICPSYMGRANLPLAYKPKKQCQVYLSASEGRQEEYGWGIVERIAGWLPNHVFHLYGASWKTRHPNVIVHGRVKKETMNAEIKGYQVGLRLNETDGFSEILAKAVLMGQYAIGKVHHPHIPTFENDMDLILKLNSYAKLTKANLDVRDWYRERLNSYPWNQRKSTQIDQRNGKKQR